MKRNSTSRKERKFLTHEFGPVYNTESRYLILGSFPSVKSREQKFYYGHPQNRFWKVLAALTDYEIPKTVNEKKNLLYRAQIAVYDVIDACSIIGSDDSSIKDVSVTDLTPILKNSHIGSRIFTNGGKAYELYQKFIYPELGIRAEKLPSTSPANAAWSLEKLIEYWKKALQI